ncbi:SNW/SKI-interacting protein-like protein [Tanacetum coccineum]|uniref:SNW/SKI-interacting protein-like protein n=1 Tax=Tanacetum coccineum TaxID=301880 RepID=A0ABQ4Z4K0_9ASTR
MAALMAILPHAKASAAATFYDHSIDPWFTGRYNASTSEDKRDAFIKTKCVPLYGTQERLIYRPSTAQDFGDGGAFPDIHYAQYPLDMGRKKDSSSGIKTLPFCFDNLRNFTCDAIVKQNENAKKIVYSQHRDQISKILQDDKEDQEHEVDDDKKKKIEETTQETKAALEKIVNVRLSVSQPKSVETRSQDSKFIKYKPSQQSAAFNSGANERIIRMAEMQVDPFEPPKFKHKKIPKASGSPPVPVMHSPPRPVTVQDQQDWKIPPCISNWKNSKGYTIPLDKRLAADGRGLQEVQINGKFAKFYESLSLAEQKARESLSMKAKLQKDLMMKEKERKDQELRTLAAKARYGTGTGLTGLFVTSDMITKDTDEPDQDPPRETKEELEQKIRRENTREKRHRERERERRLEGKDTAIGKKRKINRDRDRDITEKVALGMASSGASRGGEVMYDQRLFNQEMGMGSGFETDDQYNVYDKKLFTAQPTLSSLYKPKKDTDDEMYDGANEQVQKIRKTDRFKPHKGFTDAGKKTGQRGGPVEFEKQVAAEADPFGLDKFITQLTGRKKPLDKVGSGGTMSASGGSSTREGYEGSGRNRIGFEKGC